MSEVTVPDALSGEEILNAICDDVRQALKRDCHLNPYLAYMTYECEIRIKIKLKDSGREPEVEQTIMSSMGTREQRSELKSEAWSSSYVMEPERPPNLVRQETGQPIPAVVDTATGRKEMRSMRFAKRTEPEPEHEKKEHEHDPKNPQPQPKPGQQPQQEPKR